MNLISLLIILLIFILFTLFVVSRYSIYKLVSSEYITGGFFFINPYKTIGKQFIDKFVNKIGYNKIQKLKQLSIELINTSHANDLDNIIGINVVDKICNVIAYIDSPTEMAGKIVDIIAHSKSTLKIKIEILIGMMKYITNGANVALTRAIIDRVPLLMKWFSNLNETEMRLLKELFQIAI